jgi:hypothetical protein
MPWDCACGVHIEQDDETTCPSCGERKSAWTLVADRTRTLSVTTRRAPLFRGEDAAPRPRDAGWDDVALAPASEVVALEAELLRQLAEAGLGPAPAHVLVARVPAGKDGTVTVLPEFGQREVEPVTLADDAADPGAGRDVRLLLVFGDGAGDPALAPPGVHVVDVGEGTPLGYAPQVGVTAVTRKRTALPVVAGLRAFRWSV